MSAATGTADDSAEDTGDEMARSGLTPTKIANANSM